MANQSSRIQIVGSYAYPGIPLLEGCVGSAIRVTRQLVRERKRRSLHEEREQCEFAHKHRIGGVDWSSGAGSQIGQWWRWRWVKDGAL